MGKLQVNGIIQATGSLVTGSKFSLTKTAATKSTATDQDLVINYNLPSGTSLTDSNSPGIGFHVGNTCWGQMVYNNGFKFYNGGDFSSLTNVYANNFIGNLSGNATSASAAPWSGITGKPSTFPPSSHTHDYLPLADGGTLTGSAVINFPAGSVSVAASTPMSLSYGRLACYGTLCINANTDNSGTEYVILTAGKGLSSSAADGLAIGTSTLTWQGSTVITSGNYTSYCAPASHNHTSLSNITSLTFATHADDSATIGANVDGSSTYFDFNLLDDGATDKFRWRFGRYDSATATMPWSDLMTLTTISPTDSTAYLRVNGTISADWFSGTASNASYLVSLGGTTTASVRNYDSNVSLSTGGWADANAGYGWTYGTTLDISGYSTWYHRLAFRTDGNIEYWHGINTKTMTKVGNLCFTGHSHSYLPLSGGTVTGTITSNAAMPFMFYGAGSSTYTCACMYINSGGMIFETPRAGNDISYAPLPFRVVSRGGWESGYYAPLYCQKVIVQNYGGSLPSSGVTGEIFYKT